jgi:hypothetical protein
MAIADDEEQSKEGFMRGVKQLVSLQILLKPCRYTEAQFWAPGSLELFALTTRPSDDGDRCKQIYVIPFAKSATTSQHSPVSSLG